MSLSERNITFRVQDAWGEQRLGDLSANSFASKQCMQEKKIWFNGFAHFLFSSFWLTGERKRREFCNEIIFLFGPDFRVWNSSDLICLSKINHSIRNGHIRNHGIRIRIHGRSIWKIQNLSKLVQTCFNLSNSFKSVWTCLNSNFCF